MGKGSLFYKWRVLLLKNPLNFGFLQLKSGHDVQNIKTPAMAINPTTTVFI